MIFTDLPAGAAVFLDASTLVYHSLRSARVSGPRRPTDRRSPGKPHPTVWLPPHRAQDHIVCRLSALQPVTR
jgi:hypothetical protein